jgi:hypothetical protein
LGRFQKQRTRIVWTFLSTHWNSRCLWVLSVRGYGGLIILEKHD